MTRVCITKTKNMKLVKYNPLNDYVPSTFGGLIENMLHDGRNDGSFYPPVDIIKNDDGIVLNVFAPGMGKSDFELNVEHNTLKISGERKLNKEVNYTKRESSFGNFERSFNLADTIDSSKISAEYINGVLKVTLPLDKKKIEKKMIEVK